jgi:nitrogen regulatory protein PII-like uncharacterized protein
MTEESVAIEQLADLAGAGNVLKTVAAWRVMKRTHDVADAKLACCKHTVALFNALDELEKDIVGIVRQELSR